MNIEIMLKQIGQKMEENKWISILLSYSNNKELETCPKCGGSLEVITTELGRKSITFHCLKCNEFAHFDGTVSKP